MNDGHAIDSHRMSAETGDDLRLSSAVERSWPQPGHTALPVWLTASQDKYGTGRHIPGEEQRDVERIACLECIIAILIEKNEHMRQQLRMYMD